MRKALLVLVAALALPGTAVAAPLPSRWCGNDLQAGDRLPDLVSGFQFHTVYAYPADGPDRFAEAVLPIARDLAAVDEWWRGQDASRAARFDLFAFPGCDSAFGNLDISHVRLPQPSSVYARVGPGLAALLEDLGTALDDPDKKYLVFYDGAMQSELICGASRTNALRGGAAATSLVFLRSICGELGSGAGMAITAVHEMIHNLGALPPGAPHRCSGDAGHPCDSEADILYPSVTVGEILSAKLLDVGRDDYYGHAGAQWDVQDSPWLEQLESADRLPPAGPASLSATGQGASLTLSWSPATDDGGAVRYRVYRNGAFLIETDATSFTDTGTAGSTLEYVVRARDGVNHLGDRLTLRFTVGLGIVDGEGRLVRDTVAPGPVHTLRARRTGQRVTFSWAAAADRGGIRAYRVIRNGRQVALVSRRSLTVAVARSRGVWSVRAVDRAGNVGAAGATLRLR